MTRDEKRAKQAAYQKAKRLADPEAFRAKQRRYYASDRARHREYQRRHLLSRPSVAYKAEQLDQQGGRCDCCGTSEPRGRLGWHLDHDHRGDGRRGKTWQLRPDFFRGVLCMVCNMTLVSCVEKYPEMRPLIPVVDAYLSKWEGIIRERLRRLDAA